MQTKKFDARTICMVGIMAALVFVGTNLRIKIPAGTDGVMLHLGNVFCLLGGLLFGGITARTRIEENRFMAYRKWTQMDAYEALGLFFQSMPQFIHYRHGATADFID